MTLFTDRIWAIPSNKIWKSQEEPHDYIFVSSFKLVKQ